MQIVKITDDHHHCYPGSYTAEQAYCEDIKMTPLVKDIIMSSTRMPALFLGHGSPMNVLEDNLYTRKRIVRISK